MAPSQVGTLVAPDNQNPRAAQEFWGLKAKLENEALIVLGVAELFVELREGETG